MQTELKKKESSKVEAQNELAQTKLECVRLEKCVREV
jgi:hypothetical protein